MHEINLTKLLSKCLIQINDNGKIDQGFNYEKTIELVVLLVEIIENQNKLIGLLDVT